MERGYIKLWRKIEDFDWYKNPVVLTLWIHILLNANHSNKPYQGLIIKRGTFKTGLKKLTYETGLSIQQVRTGLDKLTATNNITSKITNKYRIITVVNYDNFQDNNKQVNKQITIKQQSNNKQITTTNKDNNLKKEKNDKNIIETVVLPFEDIIDYFNTKCNTKYRHSTPKTRTLIKSRFKDGFTLDDFYKVIDIKYDEWYKTEMAKFLRPETLFSNKFEGYLNQLEVVNTKGIMAKNKLPEDIEEPEWLKDYIKEVKES